MKALRFPPTVVPSGRPFPHHPPVVIEARVPIATETYCKLNAPRHLRRSASKHPTKRNPEQ